MTSGSGSKRFTAKGFATHGARGKLQTGGILERCGDLTAVSILVLTTRSRHTRVGAPSFEFLNASNSTSSTPQTPKS